MYSTDSSKLTIIFHHILLHLHIHLLESNADDWKKPTDSLKKNDLKHMYMLLLYNLFAQYMSNVKSVTFFKENQLAWTCSPFKKTVYIN